MPNSYKVEMRAVGESSFNSNGIRLPSPEQAEAYGHDLFCRWFGADEYRVAPSDDQPNHTADEQGRLTRYNPPFEVVEIMRTLDRCQEVTAEMQAQIYKRLQALKHVVSECKYINETVTDDETFAVQMMQVIAMAEAVLDNMSNLPENWKE